MAINKAFVVKNSLEVNTDLVLANATTKRVGIATTQPGYTLDVAGGIGVTNLYVSGISTFRNEFYVRSNSTTVLSALGVGGSVGVGTALPGYLLDVRSPVSTGQTALYVQGDVRVTGDLLIDDLTVDLGNFNNLTVDDTLYVTGITTLRNNLNVGGVTTSRHLQVIGVSTLGSLSASGISTFNNNVNISGVTTTQHLRVTGVSTIASLFASGISTITNDVNISGVTTTQHLRVTGVSTIASLFASGISTITNDVNISGVTTTQHLRVTGVSTLGSLSASGISTFNNNVNISGVTTTQHLLVTGISTIASLFASGISTITNDVNISGVTTTQHLRVTGVSTIASLFASGITTITNNVNIAGVTTTQHLLVTGISTIGTGVTITSGGNINAVSGVITATRFVGSGSSLTGNARNLTATIGIGATGGVVGYAVSFVNFVGPSISTTLYNSNAGIATIFFIGERGNVSMSVTSIAPGGGVENGDLWFNVDDGRTYLYYDEVIVGSGSDAYWVDASPASPFNVGILTEVSLSFVPGSAVSPSWYFDNSATTGVFSPVAGQITFVSAGSSIININPGGINVTGVSTVSSNLSVAGVTTTQHLRVTGVTTTVNISASGITTTGTLSVSGVTGTQHLQVTGVTTTSNISAGIVTATEFDVSTSTFNPSGINVVGVITASSDIKIGTNSVATKGNAIAMALVFGG
jgi:hypothetical protein